jgi:hypothetical protein
VIIKTKRELLVTCPERFAKEKWKNTSNRVEVFDPVFFKALVIKQIIINLN